MHRKIQVDMQMCLKCACVCVLGVSLGAMAVPQAIAFAILAGLPPTAGLYASALLPIVVGAISGRPGSISAASSASAAVIRFLTADGGPLDRLSKVDRQQFLSTVLLVSAAVQILCGVFGVARLMCLLPHPAVMGFMNALAIVIAMNQFEVWKYCPNGAELPVAMEGVIGAKDEGGGDSGVSVVLRRFDDCHRSELEWLPIGSIETWLTTIHVLMAMAVVLFLPRIPRIGRLVPASFAALVFGLSLEVGVFRGAFDMGTRTVGDTTRLPTSLPTFHSPMLPDGAGTGDIGTLLQFALTISLVGLVQSLVIVNMMCRLLRDPESSDPVSSGNVECVAQGVGSFVCSIFGAMGGSGLTGPSALNIINGGSRRVSTITSGIFMFLVILVAGPIVEMVPMACLAGILFAMVYHMIDWDTFKLIRFGSWTDCILVLLVSILGVVWDLAFAMLIACGIAGLNHTYYARRTEGKIEVHQRYIRASTLSLMMRHATTMPPVEASTVELGQMRPYSTSIEQCRRDISIIAATATATAVPSNITSHSVTRQMWSMPHHSRESTAGEFKLTTCNTDEEPKLHARHNGSLECNTGGEIQSTLVSDMPSKARVDAQSDKVQFGRDLFEDDHVVTGSVGGVASSSSVSLTPLKVYVLVGRFSYATIADFVLLIDPADDPPLVCIDFTQCILTDYTAIWAVREVIRRYAEKHKSVASIGFEQAIEIERDLTNQHAQLQAPYAPPNEVDADPSCDDRSDGDGDGRLASAVSPTVTVPVAAAVHAPSPTRCRRRHLLSPARMLDLHSSDVRFDANDELLYSTATTEENQFNQRHQYRISDAHQPRLTRARSPNSAQSSPSHAAVRIHEEEEEEEEEVQQQHTSGTNK